MGFDQQGAVVLRVLRVLRNESGRWDVFENDFEKPLASFVDRQDASDYANKLCATKEGSAILMLDESTPVPPHFELLQPHRSRN
ncbi:MAG: hypothetical protein A3I66_05855 [Burkholderiales bacterium RIFCSPLOWO2_02_FULL_57_36]|nr:MAG: hypothetical protein A3I66_05855 [Burkholderiales bacterium RIFCSPLOWO2_02_FULL_57_36]